MLLIDDMLQVLNQYVYHLLSVTVRFVDTKFTVTFIVTLISSIGLTHEKPNVVVSIKIFYVHPQRIMSLQYILKVASMNLQQYFSSSSFLVVLWFYTSLNFSYFKFYLSVLEFHLVSIFGLIYRYRLYLGMFRRLEYLSSLSIILFVSSKR